MPNPKLRNCNKQCWWFSVNLLNQDKIEIKNDKDGNLAASIGKKSFADAKIKENYEAIKQTILKEKPNGIKGDFILSTFLDFDNGHFI